MVFNIALVEDDQETADKIKGFVDRYTLETGIEFNFVHFLDGDDITYEYEPKYDIIFLDVEMKHLDGVKTAEYIRTKDENVILIFMTNMAQYAIKGYSVNALDFLLKPVPYFAFAEQLKKTTEIISKKKTNSILITDADGTHKIEKRTIMYVESYKHKIIVHTEKQQYSFFSSMKQMEDVLHEENFFRAGASYLVNLLFVKSITGGSVIVAGDKLPLSRAKKKEFMDALAKVLGGVN